ncbi:hypothetical protein PCC8801_3271 [Rippkaea orientalis PCC 8801]|uniref:Uncharacterized protein n=1 Tax=Rippkaea orientalis (strain PCC 8801 / RF-1) TaxID=41431 RepID=B7JYE2_RIPO1|nr:hypothetical protein [Rippkaea orientalis]ACK67244.1 hypothetical protein PCC8801_3271 [Rippkaea orientalis PCC 8801]
MIIADLEHLNIAGGVNEVAGGNLAADLAIVLPLVTTGVPFAFNSHNVQYLSLGSMASYSNVTQEYLATSVNGSRISSGKLSLSQIAFG